VVTITQVREPRWNLVGFIVLEQLMDTAAAQARRRGDLPNGEAGVTRGDAGLDPLLFGLMQMRGRQAPALFGLLFAQEALVAFFLGVHARRIPIYGSGVQQTGRESVLFCSAAPGRPICDLMRCAWCSGFASRLL
jgi:hypothetical protein